MSTTCMSLRTRTSGCLTKLNELSNKELKQIPVNNYFAVESDNSTTASVSITPKKLAAFGAFMAVMSSSLYHAHTVDNQFGHTAGKHSTALAIGLSGVSLADMSDNPNMQKVIYALALSAFVFLNTMVHTTDPKIQQTFDEAAIMFTAATIINVLAQLKESKLTTIANIVANLVSAAGSVVMIHSLREQSSITPSQTHTNNIFAAGFFALLASKVFRAAGLADVVSIPETSSNTQSLQTESAPLVSQRAVGDQSIQLTTPTPYASINYDKLQIAKAVALAVAGLLKVTASAIDTPKLVGDACIAAGLTSSAVAVGASGKNAILSNIAGIVALSTFAASSVTDDSGYVAATAMFVTLVATIAKEQITKSVLSLVANAVQLGFCIMLLINASREDNKSQKALGVITGVSGAFSALVGAISEARELRVQTKNTTAIAAPQPDSAGSAA